MISHNKDIHNKLAPYWAIAMVLLGLTGLSSVWFYLGDFWNSYILDITGPAWNYILFRGLFTTYANNKWTQFFTPTQTLIIFIIVCYSIEAAQYFKFYDSTFDPWDLVSYISVLTPLYLLDQYQLRYTIKEN
jgi:hypothetical protein